MFDDAHDRRLPDLFFDYDLYRLALPLAGAVASS